MREFISHLTNTESLYHCNKIQMDQNLKCEKQDHEITVCVLVEKAFLNQIQNPGKINGKADYFKYINPKMSTW